MDVPSIPLALEVLRAVRPWAGRRVVIKYGGAAITAARAGDPVPSAGPAPSGGAPAGEDDGVLAAVALLQAAGARPVLVHGGGPEVSRLMERLGKRPEFVDGLRVTDAETMEIAEMALAGKINKELVARLARLGARAVGISGKDGALFVAERLLHRTADGRVVDLGLVGEVRRVNTDVISVLEMGRFLPVVATVALGEDGRTYNVNADLAAGALAAALRADDFILLTDVPGILRDVGDESSLCRRLTAAEAESLVSAGVVTRGMLPKVRACVDAVRRGARRAVIMDGRDHGRLGAFVLGHDVPCTVVEGGLGR